MQRRLESPAVSGAANGTRRQRAWLVLLIVVVAVVVAATHWPVLSAQALSFDDGQFLTDNPLVRNPSWVSAGRFFAEVLEPSTVEGYYLPLSMVSLMLDYATGGRPENLRPFHRTNLALHVANTVLIIVLLFSLLRGHRPCCGVASPPPGEQDQTGRLQQDQRSWGRPWAAALAGLLFGVHALTVEPVAWVGERKTLLAAFFALSCMICYVRHARRGGRAWLVTSLVMYLLALLSKPTAVPLVALLLLIDYWPLRRLTLRTTIEKAPFFLLAGTFAIITWISHSHTAGIQVPGQDSVLRVPLTMCHLIVFYLQKIVWPANLTSLYPLPEPMSLSNPAVVLGVVGTVVLVGLLVLSLRRTRALLTGWLIFFIAILPTLGIVEYSWVTASDKYVYLPSIGLLMVLAAAVAVAWDGAGRHSAGLRIGLVALALLLSVAEVRGTRSYLRHWRDSEALFRYMVSVEPTVAFLHYELGTALRRQGRLDEALHEYGLALKLYPLHADSRNNVGLILRLKGRHAEAIQHFTEVLRTNPQYVNARVNLASALGDSGRFEEAEGHYREALAIAPDDPQVFNAFGTSLFRQGRTAEAIDTFRQAIRLNPRHVSAMKNLAPALAALGRYAEAAEVCRAAIKLDPGDPRLRYNLGVALQQLGKPEEAIEVYREVLWLEPGFVDARGNLAFALSQEGRTQEAIAQYREALRLDRNHVQARRGLDALLAKQSDLDRP